MIKNNVIKFIDSCVGSIARKIQDEFDESKHPRDKGGKFTSKGGEGRGGGDVESSKKFSKRINTAVDKFESMFKSDPQQAKEHLYALGVDADEADSFKEIEADVISAVTKNLNRAEAKLRIDEDEDSGEGSDQKLINTYKAGKITPERADALNEAAVALEEAGVPIQKILKMSNEGDLEGMQKLLESKRSSESGDDSNNNSENEVSIDSLTGNETYGPAVVNALRYEYDGDPKKVGAVVNHLNNITSEPDMWGEYTVNEIIDDIEGRFGQLSDVTKRHIDTYLRKTNPAEWASEAEYWKQKFKNNPGPHPQSFYE